MSVHYDIEAIEKRLRALLADVPFSPGATPGSKVRWRNKELDVQAAMLAPRELNRGTPPIAIIEAHVEVLCDSICSVLGGPEKLSDEIIGSLSVFVVTRLTRARSREGVVAVARMDDLPCEPGGHA